MERVAAVVLAAGEGKRMKSDIPKVLHTIANKPIIDYVLDAVRVLNAFPVMIVGKLGDSVRAYVGKSASYVNQEEQLGTGHAVLMAKAEIERHPAAYVLVVAGDMPLLTSESLQVLCEQAQEQHAAAALLSAVVPNPAGYGRVIRDENGNVSAIVEEKDANASQRAVTEINSGIYCFEKQALLSALQKLTNDNAQKEYYLTDCIGIITREGKKAIAVQTDAQQCMGINDRIQLYEASRAVNRLLLMNLIENGVTVIDMESTYIEPDVSVAEGTVIYPGNTLQGNTRIGKNCVLYPGSRILDSTIADGVTIQNSVILESSVGVGTTVGPYAYLRPGSQIGAKCRIGDFVEVKKSIIGNGSKVSHLSYVGDGEIGEGCNIGCGVVFVNYDGKNKSKTVLEDNVFCGCNVNLVAPVTVHEGAYIAAGSTVTEDVPQDALCVARERQVIKEGWARKRREIHK